QVDPARFTGQVCRPDGGQGADDRIVAARRPRVNQKATRVRRPGFAVIGSAPRAAPAATSNRGAVDRRGRGTRMCSPKPGTAGPKALPPVRAGMLRCRSTFGGG